MKKLLTIALLGVFAFSTPNANAATDVAAEAAIATSEAPLQNRDACSMSDDSSMSSECYDYYCSHGWDCTDADAKSALSDRIKKAEEAAAANKASHNVAACDMSSSTMSAECYAYFCSHGWDCSNREAPIFKGEVQKVTIEVPQAVKEAVRLPADTKTIKNVFPATDGMWVITCGGINYGCSNESSAGDVGAYYTSLGQSCGSPWWL